MCVDYLWKSERYELIAEINKPVIAVFEKRRDFKVLRLMIGGLLTKAWGNKLISCVFVSYSGYRSCTTTFTARTWRWQRWWTLRNACLVATIEWPSMDRWDTQKLFWKSCFVKYVCKNVQLSLYSLIFLQSFRDLMKSAVISTNKSSIIMLALADLLQYVIL